MKLGTRLKRMVSLMSIVALFGAQAMPLQAAMIGTDTLLQQQQSRFEREQLMELLARDQVQQQLQTMGVDAQAARERVTQMTDSEVQQLNSRLGELPAGGDILGLAFLIFLIFVITDAIGATDVFTFVHPVK